MAQLSLVLYFRTALHKCSDLEHPFGALQRLVQVAGRSDQVLWLDILGKSQKKVAVFLGVDYTV